MLTYNIINSLFFGLGLLINPDNVLIISIVITLGILALTGICAFFIYKKKNNINKVTTSSKNLPSRYNRSIFASKSLKVSDLNKELEPFGFAYYPPQDLFYSIMDGWQKDCGYCELYDEASVPLYMIIDCEPIYFNYDGKKWLIELWKGQYGMTTGCEIGVYTTTGPNLNIPGLFNGTFYYSASDDDHLLLGYTLLKHDKILFTRNEKHWWLTGFRLGEFSHPSQLVMKVEITLKDSKMRDAFVEGLIKNGYARNELNISNNTVRLVYDKPHYPQPVARNSFMENFVQTFNRRNCEAYQIATSRYNNTLDKLNYVKYEAPKMYRKILNVGNTTELFKGYETIKKFIHQEEKKDKDDGIRFFSNEENTEDNTNTSNNDDHGLK
jgi:hypothetical protein